MFCVHCQNLLGTLKLFKKNLKMLNINYRGWHRGTVSSIEPEFIHFNIEQV